MTKKTMAVGLLAFIIVLLAATTLYIICSPDDVPHPQSDNSLGNLLNGGAIVSDGEITYFLRDGVLYRQFGDQVQVLTENAQAPIFLTEGGVAFLRDSGLWQVNASGGNLTCLLADTENPLVVGRWVYDTKDGRLYKTRVDDGKTWDLGLYPQGPYLISATRIFYVGQDHRVHTARTDGSEDMLLADHTAADFVQGGNQIFCRDETGLLRWFAIESPQALSTLRPVDQYNYVDGYLVFAESGGLYALQLTTLEEQTLVQEPVTCLSTDDSYLYFFTADGALHRMKPDGSEPVVLFP